ncbi:hypothetical protein SAY86_020204 [Trapa natans]|uniref:Uncharacterized protein n=1 Tax=Trapa natans TaxID=22666 RepID=A0AAN7R5C8_TRANT|nr:hypothetical protein SAY86_020204 [Trapa natans]
MELHQVNATHAAAKLAGNQAHVMVTTTSGQLMVEPIMGPPCLYTINKATNQLELPYVIAAVKPKGMQKSPSNRGRSITIPRHLEFLGRD